MVHLPCALCFVSVVGQKRSVLRAGKGILSILEAEHSNMQSCHLNAEYGNRGMGEYLQVCRGVISPWPHCYFYLDNDLPLGPFMCTSNMVRTSECTFNLLFQNQITNFALEAQTHA